MTSHILPFTLDNINVRGKLLRLDQLTNHIATLEQEHTFIATALAELLSGAALLAFDLKQNNDITLQIHSPGQIPLLLAQCSQNGRLRAFAQTEPADRVRNLNYSDLKVEGSIFAVTITQNNQPYQSLVPLDGLSVSHSLESYYADSVQLPTYFKVFTSRTADGQWHSGALFLQAMPPTSNNPTVSTDDWHRLGLLLGTISNEEIGAHGTAANTFLRHLFAEDTLRVYDEINLSFATTSTRDKMAAALKSMGAEQAQSLLDNDSLTMTDEFSGTSETFSAAELAALFTDTKKPQ